MIKRISKFIALAGLVAGWAGPAAAAPVTIDFDGLAFGTIVTNQFNALGVTFANTEARLILVSPDVSAPNQIVSLSSFDTFGEADAIVATFNDTASSVSVLAAGVGQAGARLSAFNGAGTLIGFAEVFEFAFGGPNQFTTLSVSAPGIKSVKLFQPNPVNIDGVSFDDFTFEISEPPTSLVPLPAALPLLAAGLLVLGFVRHRGRGAPRM